MQPDIRRADAAAVRPLRRAVLRPGASDAELAYPGDDDPDAGHFAAYAGEAVVAIGSVTRQPPPWSGGPDPSAWRLRGMATDPAVRGSGVGGLVLDACLAHAAAEGGTLLWCNARTPAVGFYERYGFERVGDEFDVPGIGPHYVMRRALP